MTHDLEQLALRCEQAEGPDRELDAKIALAAGWQEITLPHGSRYCIRPDGFKTSHGLVAYAPAYTASIDAALTLVPEGWFVDNLAQSGRRDGTWWAALIQPPEGDEETGKLTRDGARESAFDTPTPALALCAAVLRARAAA